MPVRAKRIYDPPSHGDGYRVLIDGIWPRGITRERAAVDQWTRELAPSAQLRQWYGHEPERFEEFARRYRAELGAQRELLSELRRRSRKGVVTLVFAARDAEHSNATVLGDVVRRTATPLRGQHGEFRLDDMPESRPSELEPPARASDEIGDEERRSTRPTVDEMSEWSFPASDPPATWTWDIERPSRG